jgi:exopolyphosphatase/guanosine-5'-triphosphate,3'-diphosphate pyrophosphatase
MDLPGFSRWEQRQLATLVRAHRRKLGSDLLDEQDHDLKHLTVLLRLATVLHRNRSHQPLPHVDVSVKDEAITLSLPKAWLKKHPLTVEDLSNEADYLSALGINLEVKKH